MEIQTTSERAQQARRLNVEMLMARAPAAEPVQEIAKDMGIEETRFSIADEDKDELTFE